MTDTIESFQTKIKVGAEQSYKNLTKFPVFSDCSIPSEHLFVNEALSKDITQRDPLADVTSATKINAAGISNDIDSFR